MKILHIADIHWRGLSRHEEYILAFKDMFEKATRLQPDIIYLGGDIVHSKTQGISPELIQCLCWWFNELAKIAPTHVILGNHDGLILNKDRQDAITPIINALNNPNIFLYKKSGTYEFAPGFEWCVLSCFDEENWFKAKPNAKNISIGLYHGAIRGSLTDVDWQLEGEDNIDLFKSYDFAMLGDIHKMQFLNEKKTIAYSGSTIQQNFGEDGEKGFLFWDIRSKNNFDVSFHSVKNAYPFVTIDWQGSVKKTVAKCKEYPNLSKFRIRADNYISQADSKQIQKILQKQKLASEVVFKIESKFSSETLKTESIQNELDLRDPAKHYELINDYYKNQGLLKEEKTQIKELIDRSLSEITDKDHDVRNVKWSINKIKFSNTFSYREDNLVNFENLPGITGIFGQNARGKSSIIGTIAYSLFNTSDRGSIKNLHIVNTRRNNCKAEIDITINGVPYRIFRQTVKKQTKKGIWAPTTLKFYKLNKSGEVIEDLTDEQRRETEKIIRSKLGDVESFMMTSLASQGEMNTFIKEKATSRKNILSNFLDLTVFDKLNEYAKKESSTLKSKIGTFKKLDWDKEISNSKNKEQSNQEKIDGNKKEEIRLRKLYEEAVKNLHQNTNIDHVTKSDLSTSREKYKSVSNLIKNSVLSLEKINEEIFDKNQKLQKIETFIDSFNLDDIKEKRDAVKEIERIIIGFKSDLKIENSKLNTIKKSVSILSEVPCGDKFPKCKFIKNSHKNKLNLEKQQDKIHSLRVKIDDLQVAFRKLNKVDYEEQIEKYNTVVIKRSQMVNEISESKVRINSCEKDIENNRQKLPNLKEKYESLLALYENQDKSDTYKILESRVDKIKREIKHLNEEQTKLITALAKVKAELGILISQKKEYQILSKDLKIYDLFIQATSSRGIPVQIIHSMLPHINKEISKILKGIVGFTIELEADLESNAMDIYINYGDSKRIVELGSGMEKMMASLAIRVALINVSTLPKTNILMIDEGFGALDETNLESCGKLLQSLKKYFRNIVIISHIDQIKDIVDNTIDIQRKGVDSYVYYP